MVLQQQHRAFICSTTIRQCVHTQTQGGGRGTVRAFEVLKPNPNATPSPTMPHLLILRQTCPPTQISVLKYMSLCGPFSFKTPTMPVILVSSILWCDLSYMSSHHYNQITLSEQCDKQIRVTGRRKVVTISPQPSIIPEDFMERLSQNSFLLFVTNRRENDNKNKKNRVSSGGAAQAKS